MDTSAAPPSEMVPGLTSVSMLNFNVLRATRSVSRDKLFEKIRKGHLTYPRYLSESAQDILHGVRWLPVWLVGASLSYVGVTSTHLEVNRGTRSLV